ncbi:hypothetical protein BN946_scf184573.g7 [Trametes cinnabarina]|uniref:Uncharacterized protein n=1 Tax=Pycnoporus cinnabarinus TaxID=5643 RepID=A0A060SE34_PYCCI|nr:hypothetical protein BN946_scf184573.g7 [Trametes cinnabarina]
MSGPPSLCGSRSMAWRLILYGLALLGTSHLTWCASAVSLATPTPLLLPRQDVVTSTSSFNWWPYPSWGAQTSSPTSEVLPSIAAVTSTLLADDTSTTNVPLTSSSAVPSSTDTIIHITALPPPNSSSSVNRSSTSGNRTTGGQFQVVYLAPLFAILGALAGMLFVWALYRYVPSGKMHRQRERSLEPGPRYTPPSAFRQTALSTPAALEEEELAGPSRSSSQPLLTAPTDAEKKADGWLARAFSSRSKVPSMSAEKALPEIVNEAPTEDDPFLDRPFKSTWPVASPGIGRKSTARTTFSQRATSPDPYGVVSDEEDAAPYETLRHKSIRRGILERLRLGTLRRPPAVADYEKGPTEDDAMLSQMDSPSGRRPTGTRRGHKRDPSDIIVSRNAMDSPARTLSAEDTPSRRSTLLRNPSELVKSPPGFRLVVEDPESGALTSAPPSRAASPAKSPTKEGTSWGWNLPWPSSPTKQRKDDDKFTSLPVRRSLADIRTLSPSPSISQSPVKSPRNADASGLARPVPLSRVDSSILPASPPCVTSPPLESQLFFGAVSPDFGSNPSLNLRLPESAETKCTQGTGAVSSRTTSGDKHAKLKTHRSPPLLPFPSKASSSPFRGRLKKTPTKGVNATASPPSKRLGTERNDSADSVDCGKAPGRGTPAQRYEARQSALNKVDEILSRSWSERQLTGDGFPGSPTNFGAFLPLPAGPSLEKLIEDEALNGMGIEQRLEALRVKA